MFRDPRHERFSGRGAPSRRLDLGHVVSSVVAAAVLVAATGCGPDTTNGWTVGPVTTSNVRDVAVSNGFVCIIADDRTVDCWGEGPSSATDLTEKEIRRENKKHTPNGQFEEIVAGSSFACGRRDDDRLKCWPSPDGFPRPLGFDPPVKRATDIAAGLFTLCVDRVSNGIVCWNKYRWPESPGARVELPDGASDLDVGGPIACGIYEDHSRVECRVAAHSNHGAKSVVPSQRKVPFRRIAVGGKRVCGILAKPTHKFPQSKSGDVACMRQHNKDHREHQSEHFDFDETHGGPFETARATSGYRCAVRKSNERVQCWGEVADGSALGVESPLSVPNGRFRNIDIGGLQGFCGVRTDGTLECAGESIPDVFE